MKALIRLLKVTMCILSSLYLTYVLSHEVLTTKIQVGFVFIYFMICSIGLLIVYEKFLRNKLDDTTGNKIKLIITSILFAFIILISVGSTIYPKPYIYNNIEIASSDTKDVNSLGNEVWITQIKVNNSIFDLSKINLNEGWIYKPDDNAIFANMSDVNFRPLNVFLNKAYSIKITFVKHAWSGAIKVINSETSENINLYDKTGASYTYNISGTANSIPLYFKVLIFIAVGTLLFSLIYIALVYVLLKIRFQLIIYLGVYTILTFWIFGKNGMGFNLQLTVILLLINCICLSISITKNIKNRIRFVLISLITPIITFCIIGDKLLLNIDRSFNSIGNLIIFLLSCVWMLPIISGSLIILDLLSNKLLITDKNFINEGIKNVNISTGNGRKIHIVHVIVYAVGLIASLAISISINQIIPMGNPDNNTIILQPLNEKNQKSLGYEVLLSDISINGKSSLNDVLRELPEGWSNNNGMIIGNGTSPLTIHFEAYSNIKLIFNKHQWSGKLKIIDGDNEKVLDLYSNKLNDNVSTYQLRSNNVISNMPFYYIRLVIIFVIVLFITVIMIYYLISSWKNKVTNKVFRLSLFVLSMYIYGIFIIASFPAAMSVDSITQLTQALGVVQINNSHPAFHTIILKYLLLVFKSPVAISIAQALMMSLVFTYLMKYLQNKLSNKVLIIFTIFFSASVNNGIYMTTIWKDIPFCISLLWLAILSLFIVNNPSDFIKKKRNILAIVVSLTFVYLFRHNGIVTFILGEIFLLIILLKVRIKKYLLAILLPIALIIIIEGPIYNEFNVNNDNVIESGGSIAPLHGIVYATVYNYNVPKEAKELLDDMMPLEKWKEIYQTYSASSLFVSNASTQNNILGKTADIGIIRLIEIYIKTFISAPTAIFKDRLYGIDLVWNVFQRNGYDWKAANDTYEIGVINNDFGYYRNDNLLTSVVSVIVRATFTNRLLDTFFWRGGIHLCFILILSFYAIIKKEYKKLIFVLPFIGNVASLILSMCWQDFRYVFFMNMFSVCFLLIILSGERGKITKDKG